LAAGAGPAAYTLDTVLAAHTGAIPSAGPAVANAGGRGGGFPGSPGGSGGFGGNANPGGGTPAFGGNGLPGSAGGFPGFPGGSGGPRGGFFGGNQGAPGGGRFFGGNGGTGGGPGGGLLFGSTPGADVTATLQADASKYTWVAATVGANEAAGYQLASGDPILAIGGFNGTDPTPTLARFEQLVSQGRIHYFIAGGRGGGPGVGASSDSQAITQWVESHFTATTVGGVTLYDLTAAAN
ncbi:MAG TPA: glycosyl transferase, partial [Candidatus Dormibacteraeota bacterium]|nr:glycosyl transferase [Candidatus Dormibacteraeota bacterium]